MQNYINIKNKQRTRKVFILLTISNNSNIYNISRLGPPENIRPVTIVTCPPKLLSVIILKRIQNKLDAYTGATQCSALTSEVEAAVTLSGQYE